MTDHPHPRTLHDPPMPNETIQPHRNHTSEIRCGRLRNSRRTPLRSGSSSPSQASRQRSSWAMTTLWLQLSSAALPSLRGVSSVCPVAVTRPISPTTEVAVIPCGSRSRKTLTVFSVTTKMHLFQELREGCQARHGPQRTDPAEMKISAGSAGEGVEAKAAGFCARYSFPTCARASIHCHDEASIAVNPDGGFRLEKSRPRHGEFITSLLVPVREATEWLLQTALRLRRWTAAALTSLAWFCSKITHDRSVSRSTHDRGETD